MKKLMILLITTMLLLTSCAKEETAPIRLGTMPTYSAAIYAVGIEQGFFDEAGVAVELTVFRSARDRDAAATADQLDGFMTDIMGAINLNAKGFPFVITSREYDDFAVMAGANVAIDALDMPKTGISENTVVEYIVDTYMTDAVEKVSIMAVPDRMGALLSGELELGVFPQPFMGIIMGKGGQVVLSTANEDFYPVVLVFDQEFINGHQESLEAFYAGYLKTVQYMQETPYEVYKSALVTFGLATDETVDFYRLPVEQYGLNQVNEKNYNDVTAWMTDKGLLDEAIPFDGITSSAFVAK